MCAKIPILRWVRYWLGFSDSHKPRMHRGDTLTPKGMLNLITYNYAENENENCTHI